MYLSNIISDAGKGKIYCKMVNVINALAGGSRYLNWELNARPSYHFRAVCRALCCSALMPDLNNNKGFNSVAELPHSSWCIYGVQTQY